MSALAKIEALKAEMARLEAEAAAEAQMAKDEAREAVYFALQDLSEKYPGVVEEMIAAAQSFIKQPETVQKHISGHARLPLPETGVKMTYKTRIGTWTGMTIGGRFKVEGISETFDSLTAAATACNQAERPGTNTRTSGTVWVRAAQ